MAKRRKPKPTRKRKVVKRRRQPKPKPKKTKKHKIVKRKPKKQRRRRRISYPRREDESTFEIPEPDLVDEIGEHLERGELVQGLFNMHVWYFRGPGAEREVELLLSNLKLRHPECRFMVSMGTGFGPDDAVPPDVLERHNTRPLPQDEVSWISTPYDAVAETRNRFSLLQLNLNNFYRPEILRAQARDTVWFRVEMLCPVRLVRV